MSVSRLLKIEIGKFSGIAQDEYPIDFDAYKEKLAIKLRRSYNEDNFDFAISFIFCPLSY